MHEVDASVEEDFFPPDQKTSLRGRWCWLEPLGIQHGPDLFEACTCADAATRYQWLNSMSPVDAEGFSLWLSKKINDSTTVDFAVMVPSDEDALQCTTDLEASENEVQPWKSDVTVGSLSKLIQGKCLGRLSLMSMDLPNRRAELGSVFFGPQLSRTRAATEAVALVISYAMDTLHFRRLEWKCHHHNTASAKAAVRFGFVFEGRLRQHMIQNGKNRDSLYYSIISSDWKDLRPAYIAWLADTNFGTSKSLSEQHVSLLEMRKKMGLFVE